MSAEKLQQSEFPQLHIHQIPQSNKHPNIYLATNRAGAVELITSLAEVLGERTATFIEVFDVNGDAYEIKIKLANSHEDLEG
ncbi:MAG: hypothetical protein ACRDEA_19620 [Microcystaceae cyanobacterium]